MAERLSNLGYLGLKKETTKGTFVIPNTFVPIYEETLSTKTNLDMDNPIVGNKFDIFQHLKGQRDHTGTIKFLAEPNTLGYFFDMFMTKGTTTGGGPYTHPFTMSATSNPNAYTVEILRGKVVCRYAGVEVNEMTLDWDANKGVASVNVSALKSFTVRQLASSGGVSGTTITLDATYDTAPTEGLVAGDLLTFEATDGSSSVNTTVASVTSGTVFEVASGTGISNSDFVFLRAQTPTYTLKEPLKWSRTNFQFAADASTAAGQAATAQTQVESGSTWTLTHAMLPGEGAKRSGSFDPAALVRGQAGAKVKVKRFFDNVDDEHRFIANQKRALVIHHYSDNTTVGDEELRMTFNNLHQEGAVKSLNTGDIIFDEIDYSAQYDSSDGSGFAVTVINNVSSI